MYIPLEYGCIEKLITSVIKKNTLDFFFSFLIKRRLNYIDKAIDSFVFPLLSLRLTH